METEVLADLQRDLQQKNLTAPQIDDRLAQLAHLASGMDHSTDLYESLVKTSNQLVELRAEVLAAEIEEETIDDK